jgi:hypothetical protein
MQVAPPQAMLKEATVMSIGALKVELPGLAKFGANWRVIDGVAEAACATSAKSAEDRADGLRIPREDAPVLVVNRKLHVDDLHDVVRPDRQIRVGRRDPSDVLG